jgi:hypothetical protein
MRATIRLSSSLLLLCLASPPIFPDTKGVTRVIGRHTLEVVMGDRRATVCCIGVDTPETIHLNRLGVFFGKEVLGLHTQKHEKR